jgi:hypothetical protein
MAITCPRCGWQFDATLFEFGHQVHCQCGAEIEYPGTDQRGGHVISERAREDQEGTKSSSPAPPTSGLLKSEPS